MPYIATSLRQACECWKAGAVLIEWAKSHNEFARVFESFELQVYLGEIPPAAAQIQLYADPLNDSAPPHPIMQQCANIPGASDGYVYVGEVARQRPYTDFTPRLLAFHPHARVPVENNLILWWSGRADLHREAQ